MLMINENINGIDVKVTFGSSINCIDLGLSGGGKTFLMAIIQAYCTKNAINCIHFDCSFKSAVIKSVLRDIKNQTSVVLMDNADLYMDDEISAFMSELTDVIFIVSIKRRLKIKAKYSLFNLKYQEVSLICEEVKV